MAGETANIAAMAEKVSNEIFSRYGWSISGPTNENFACEKLIEHQRKTNKTHPVDVVLCYDSPHEYHRHYFLTDLKSYAKGSLEKDFTKTFLDLSKSVACANISPEWRDKYVDDDLPYTISGMLFVYNHDGEYDK